MSTGRLEAFSDGVIAVAVTLLVLNISVPKLGANETLVHALLAQWPKYAAYLVSFLTIGIIWINHHVMVGRLRAANHQVLMLNLILLASIAVIPFATSLMATFLKEGAGQRLAAGIYAASFLVMGIAFASMNSYILLRAPQMLTTELSLARRRQILARSISGLLPYAIAIALSAVSAYVTLGICAGLAIFYALPVSSGTETTA